MRNSRKIGLLICAVSAALGASKTRAALTAYYPLDSDFNDASGNGVNGVFNGGTATFATGHIGTGAVDLSSGQYVDLTTASALGLTGNFTVSAFVNVDDLSNDHTILGNNGVAGDNTNQVMHLITRNDKAHMGFYSNDTGGNSSLSTGTWTHLTWQFNNGTQSIYRDGNLDASTGGHAPFAGASQIAKIGSWNGGNFFDGRIDNLAIYNTALSHSQIAYLAAGGNPTAVPAAVAEGMKGKLYILGNDPTLNTVAGSVAWVNAHAANATFTSTLVNGQSYGGCDGCDAADLLEGDSATLSSNIDPLGTAVVDLHGHLMVTTSGTYTFADNNDDGGAFFINGDGTPGSGTILAQNDGVHGQVVQTSTFDLVAGQSYRLEYLGYNTACAGCGYDGTTNTTGGGAAFVGTITGPGNVLITQESAVPEPASLTLLGAATLGLLTRRRRCA